MNFICLSTPMTFSRRGDRYREEDKIFIYMENYYSFECSYKLSLSFHAESSRIVELAG